MRAALVALLLLAGCNDKASPVPPPVAGWEIRYSPHAGTSGESFAFPAPTGATDHSDGVHYVVRRTLPPALGQTVTMVFTLDGGGTLTATEGDVSARVRLFLQRAGDGLTANEPFKRWWSIAFVELVSPGTFALSARLNPEEWSSVFGAIGNSSEAASAGFQDCLANLENAGFTFGGQFAGHGVYANGDVRFTLQSYTIS